MSRVRLEPYVTTQNEPKSRILLHVIPYTPDGVTCGEFFPYRASY